MLTPRARSSPLEPLEPGQVGGRERAVIADLRLLGEVELEDRARALDEQRDAGVGGGRADALHQRRAGLEEPGVGGAAVAGQLRERRRGRRDRDRVAVERAGVTHLAPADQVHDLGLAREERERIAARDGLAEDGQVGSDAQILLRAAGREPEARDHLVEDQQRAVLAAEARTPSR